MELLRARLGSPIGRIILHARAGALCALGFEDHRHDLVRVLERRFGPLEIREARNPFGIALDLEAYLAGDMGAIGRIAVDPGGTPFQREVWSGLCGIAAGRTISYARLARGIGHPAAVRAVGAAIGRNPVSIVIPCHRAVAADGGLAGYAGGIERKRWLLRHEGAKLTEAALL